MKKFKKYILISLVMIASVAFSAVDFFQLSLNDINNRNFPFESFRENKATVVVFILSDCPASQSYTLTLNKLAKKYAKDKVTITGVFPGTYSKENELIEFRKIYKVNFPLLKDPANTLVKYLHATIAPQCFLIDKKGEVVYKGRIDDWMYAVGKKRAAITENNLEDAIKAILSNTPVKIKETKAIGCILEDE